MKRLILILFLIILECNVANALEIVYPKSKTPTINAPSTFFIGNSKDKVIINGQTITPVEDGGFAISVPLKSGLNIFNISSGNETITYKITRPTQNSKITLPQRNFYPLQYRVAKDNATLRQTPVDAGINRLSQLPLNTQLTITGEKNGFYKVVLSKDNYAWIDKKDVEQIIPEKITQIKTTQDEEYKYYYFKTPKQIPFSILNQDDKLNLKLYNAENNEVFEFTPDLETVIGYDYYYEDEKTFVLKARYKFPQKPVITIDAGHGGNEYGAVGCCGDKEKDINLKIAKYLKKELHKEYKIVMTRENDKKVTLDDRVKLAKDNNSTLLVSIHSNALPDGENPMEHRGTSVYYYHTQARELGENILNQITTQTGTNDDKLRQRSLALVRPTNSISVLIEVAYMINPYDNMELRKDKFQRQVAKAIADGIREYLK